MTPKQIARFWSKVDKSGECYIWIGSKDLHGYGQFYADGRQQGAHRIAWELEHGPIPPGKEVCHNCPGGDNRACVRHLWLGTHKENMHDAFCKGRMQGKPRGGPGANKLTLEIVHEIRASHAAGMSHAAISRQFEIHSATVSNIVRGKTWTEDPNIKRVRSLKVTNAQRQYERRLRMLAAQVTCRFKSGAGLFIGECWVIPELPVAALEGVA